MKSPDDPVCLPKSLHNMLTLHFGKSPYGRPSVGSRAIQFLERKLKDIVF